MTALTTWILPSTFIRRSRMLPVPGEVMVRPGQIVHPPDTVAQASVSLKHYMVDVYRSLGAASPAAAEKLVPYKPGHRLEHQDIIAETGGMFSRVVRTPGPGTILSTKGGKVLIEAESQRLTVKAGLSGRVSEIIADRGVMIDFHGALVQGVWGNGQTGCGMLNADPASLADRLGPATLGFNSRGAVVLAGWCDSADVLNTAAADGIAGLILGSLPARLIPQALAQPYPVLVLGGFGLFGLDEISKTTLFEFSGSEISLNCIRWDRLSGDRPEAYIALGREGEAAVDPDDFAPGQTVRVNSGPFCGKIGVIDRIIPGLSLLASGLRVSAANVSVDEKIGEVIPLVNLDIIQTGDVTRMVPGEGG